MMKYKGGEIKHQNFKTSELYSYKRRPNFLFLTKVSFLIFYFENFSGRLSTLSFEIESLNMANVYKPFIK